MLKKIFIFAMGVVSGVFFHKPITAVSNHVKDKVTSKYDEIVDDTVELTDVVTDDKTQG